MHIYDREHTVVVRETKTTPIIVFSALANEESLYENWTTIENAIIRLSCRRLVFMLLEKPVLHRVPRLTCIDRLAQSRFLPHVRDLLFRHVHVAHD
jgi:hypothetical protein